MRDASSTDARIAQWLHALDLLNLALLTAPVAWALLALSLRRDSFTGNPVAVFLGTAALPIVAFFLIAKFDLPMAQDWDIPAPYAVVLTVFGLTRASLANPAEVQPAVRRMAQRMPSYITIKEVKKRWGRGQEDVFPVAQFERLWGDMTALDDFPCHYIEVPRRRGQQLKDVAQLDPWVRDGSASSVASLINADHLQSNPELR